MYLFKRFDWRIIVTVLTNQTFYYYFLLRPVIHSREPEGRTCRLNLNFLEPRRIIMNDVHRVVFEPKSSV